MSEAHTPNTFGRGKYSRVIREMHENIQSLVLVMENYIIPQSRNETLDEAIAAMPSTAENPNEDAYQRGRFDAIIEYQRALLAMKVDLGKGG